MTDVPLAIRVKDFFHGVDDEVQRYAHRVRKISDIEHLLDKKQPRMGGFLWIRHYCPRCGEHLEEAGDADARISGSFYWKWWRCLACKYRHIERIQPPSQAE